MLFLESTYRTLSGTKEVIEIPKKKSTQWIIYQDNQPKFFVDFYDIKVESNSIMNILVMCSKRSIHDVLELINKKNNVNLSIPKISRFGLKVKLKSDYKQLNLQPIPKEWLSYSL